MDALIILGILLFAGIPILRRRSKRNIPASGVRKSTGQAINAPGFIYYAVPERETEDGWFV
jgi:hypothetical protein